MEVVKGGYLPTAKRRGKYLTLATDTEVNSCFSIYENSEIIYTTKKLVWMISSLVTDANRDAIFPELLGGN